ncbi:MAG: thioredoxin family protein [Desulfovibrionaceae bacterium]
MSRLAPAPHTTVACRSLVRVLAAGLLALLCLAAPALAGQEPTQLPVPGKVTMIDLGAKACIPCKMMQPILAELEREYEGRAAIVFIDVWENTEMPQRYGLRAIPTQIFYDAQGKEQYRHEGFFDKASIEGVLKSLGVR